jgi:hypothetical protein
LEPVECAGAEELGELAVDEAEAWRAFGLEQEDGAVEVGETGADERGDRHEVAAHEEAGGLSAGGQGRRVGAVVAVEDRWLVGHEEPANRGCGAGPSDAAVDARHASLLPQGKVQVRDVAEPDEGFGVTTDGVAVEAVKEAIGAGSARAIWEPVTTRDPRDVVRES